MEKRIQLSETQLKNMIKEALENAWTSTSTEQNFSGEQQHSPVPPQKQEVVQTANQTLDINDFKGLIQFVNKMSGFFKGLDEQFLSLYRAYDEALELLRIAEPIVKNSGKRMPWQYYEILDGRKAKTYNYNRQEILSGMSKASEQFKGQLNMLGRKLNSGKKTQ